MTILGYDRFLASGTDIGVYGTLEVAQREDRATLLDMFGNLPGLTN